MKEDRDFLKEMFTRISQKVGKPYSALAPMEEELRKNWYDTPEAVMGMTDAQFQKVGIPLRVITLIREELKPQEVKQPKSFDLPPQQDNPLRQSRPNNNEVKPTKIILNQGTILLRVQQLQNKLMQNHPWVGQQLLQILQTVHKIIKNITIDSYELKFRVLKKSNAKIREVILANPPVLQFLKQIGFQEDQEKVFLDAFDTHAFFFVQECLESVVSNHQQQNTQQNQHLNKVNQKQENMFLPMDIKLPSKFEKEHRQESVNLKQHFPKESLEEANYADMLDSLTNFRTKIMSTAPKQRSVKIYHKRYDVRQVSQVVFDMDQELQKSQFSHMAKYWTNVIKENQKNAKFQSRRKMQFEYLVSQQVYRQTTIKLRLPNELIIEAQFGPLQTLGDVFNMLTNIIVGQFYLYQSPPVKRLDKEFHRTLDSLDSVPCGYFFIGLNSQWYIQNEFYTKIRM